MARASSPPRKKGRRSRRARVRITWRQLFGVVALLPVALLAVTILIALPGAQTEAAGETGVRPQSLPRNEIFGGLVDRYAPRTDPRSSGPPRSSALARYSQPGSRDPLPLVRSNKQLVWPIAGRFVTSPFGPRMDPVHGMGVKRHRGIDVRADCGVPIVAVASGQVEAAEWSDVSGWVVRLRHSDGMMTRYAHLSQIHVSKGAQVRAGERLGLSGGTGRTTGPHLHFEVWERGAPRNPMAYRYQHLPSEHFTKVAVSAVECGSYGAGMTSVAAWSAGLPGASDDEWDLPDLTVDPVGGLFAQ
jgi:murein DD-endopeptidase MepM/ murein hydrolase activator NlpD